MGSYVQSGFHYQGTPATTVVKAFTSNNTSSNQLAVGVAWANAVGSPDVTSVTDSAGNTYTRAHATVHNGFAYVSAWYCLSAIAGANTVTAHFASGTPTGQQTVFIWEGSGEGALDVVATANGDGSSTSGAMSIPITTAGAGETVFAVFAQSGAGDPTTAGTGYTVRQDDGTGQAIEDRVSAPSGAQNATAQQTAFVCCTCVFWGQWAGIAVAFKAGSAVAAPDAIFFDS